MAYDVARNLEPEYRDHRDCSPSVMREYIERGQERHGGGRGGSGSRSRRACRARVAEGGWLDALLVPAALGEAPLRSEGHTGDPLLCRAWTLLGVPAVSVPGLTGPAGMPVGVQLVGLDEAAVLAGGGAVEAALA